MVVGIYLAGKHEKKMEGEREKKEPNTEPDNICDSTFAVEPSKQMRGWVAPSTAACPHL